MVGQEPVLYARSLIENIAYGLLESEWSQDDVQEAAKLANAHMFVCCKYVYLYSLDLYGGAEASVICPLPQWEHSLWSAGVRVVTGWCTGSSKAG